MENFITVVIACAMSSARLLVKQLLLRASTCVALSALFVSSTCAHLVSCRPGELASCSWKGRSSLENFCFCISRCSNCKPCCTQVLDRGERIELLVDKTDHLQNESFAFKREARRLKTRLWWKNMRLLAFVALLILVIAYIIVCFACSPTFHC